VWDKGRVCFKVEQICIAVMDAAIALLCHIYRFQILSSRCQKSAVYIGLPTGKKKKTPEEAGDPFHHLLDWSMTHWI